MQGDSAKASLTLTTLHMHTDWDKPLGLMNACNRCLAGEPTLGRLPVREVMGLGRLLPRRWVGHAPASVQSIASRSDAQRLWFGYAVCIRLRDLHVWAQRGDHERGQRVSGESGSSTQLSGMSLTRLLLL